MPKDLIKPTIAEFIGTFALVFVGGAAVASGQGVVVAALGHGLILIALVYAYGHLSETHVNPAVTAGLLIGGIITPTRAIFYWIAQFAGGLVAAIVVGWLTGGNPGPTTGSLTSTDVWKAAVFEFVITFFLVSTVYQVAVYGHGGNLAGLAIGVTLAAGIFAAGTYTGGSMNPARTVGPAIVAGDLSYVLPYLIGIFGGGIFAGLLHTYVLGSIKEK